jgi:hypothetical protein
MRGDATQRDTAHWVTVGETQIRHWARQGSDNPPDAPHCSTHVYVVRWQRWRGGGWQDEMRTYSVRATMRQRNMRFDPRIRIITIADSWSDAQRWCSLHFMQHMPMSAHCGVALQYCIHTSAAGGLAAARLA